MNPLVLKKLNGETQTISGSMFVRDSGMGMTLPKGKKLMTVMGVILVDEDKFPIEGESMVQVAGYTTHGVELVLVNPEKRPDLHGQGADQIFMSPIWRA